MADALYGEDDDYSEAGEEAVSEDEGEEEQQQGAEGAVNAEGGIAVAAAPAKREVAKESKALKFLTTHHPECRLDYREDILQKMPLSQYPPDKEGPESVHRSVPFLTVYEKTKIIGFRANQLAQGARPLIAEVPEHVTDVLEIARMELEQRRLPFILKRPMPDGTYEYWRLSDLLIL